MNTNNIATIELNPGSELISDNYIWVPETSDNVVPGLASLLTYLETQYITLVALNNAIFLSYEQTMLDVEDSYVNKLSISRCTTDFDGNRLRFPMISDDVVPGLLSILEYLELNYATITSLQNAITDMNNHIQTEIDNIEIPTNPGVSKINRPHYIHYEHNIFKKINKHIHNKKNYNFYNDTFNFKKEK